MEFYNPQIVADYLSLLSTPFRELAVPIDGEHLEEYIKHFNTELNYEMPHIFELILIVHEMSLLNSLNIMQNYTFWSQSKTSYWNPMKNTMDPALFVIAIKGALHHKFRTATLPSNRKKVTLEKAGREYLRGVVLMLPENKGVNRKLVVDEKDIKKFMLDMQFPSTFFNDPKEHKQVNKWIALRAVDRLLLSEAV